LHSGTVWDYTHRTKAGFGANLRKGGFMANIYFIDDDVFSLKLMEKVASLLGHTSSSTPSPHEALVVLQEQRPDLIFVDMQMSEMSGIEFTRRLRRSENGQNIPLVILSAEKTEKDEDAAYMVGADGFLVKPISIDKLESLVTYFQKSGRTFQQLKNDEPTSAAA
jgi:CheY-like chemotaxis protein